MKIKRIIMILFIVLCAIPMTLMGLANMYYYNIRLENVMENDLRNTATIQMQAIESFLTERKTDAGIVVRNSFVHEALAGEGQPEWETAVALTNQILLLRAENNPYIESATVLNTDFTVVACSQPSAIGETSKLKSLDPKYFTPELQLTPVIETGREGNCSRIIAAVMEILHEGQLEGYLVFELNLTFFDELRDSAEVYNNGTVYIVDGNNALITAGDAVSSREDFVLTQDERMDYHRAWEARDKTSGSGLLHYTALGEHYISYYSQFSGIDWIILSSVNIDRVLESRRGYLEWIVLIIIVLIGLLLAVNYIVRRYLGRPIQRMIKKFKIIEDTKDYSIRMEDTGSNEIGTISSNINRLLAGMEQYIEKERQIKADLKTKAERDPLTGLYNKEAFARLLQRQLEKSHQLGVPLACVFLDIDDFKDFNTNHGHTGGDRVLLFLAEALRSQVGDLACRQGGDEFAVCIPDASDPERVESMLQDLTISLRHGLRLDEKGRLIAVNCSIGVVFSDENTITAAQLIEYADKAMYTVKKAEKNGYCIIKPEKP
ncbi:MAG: diguanylate cyclase [Oscillospiraceae bacterium]|nr:diguanylate cyclase [Oscillospiraceae bacterium]